MTPSAGPKAQNISHYIDRQINSPNQTFKIALVLSLALHVLLFMPGLLSKPSKRPLPSENLVEVKIVTNKPTHPKAAPKKKVPKSNKPILKHKRKLKTKKKKAPKKKSPDVVKESTLARRPSKPKKKTPTAGNKLDKIKKRLARQQEEKKLNEIRQRLRNNASPAAQARQSSLTQAYNRTLTAWIMRNWHLPEHLLNSGLEATISLTIAASGALLNQTEEQLSGNTIFDHAMRQAINNANPFPPFPAELTIPQEEFVITFNPNNITKEN